MLNCWAPAAILVCQPVTWPFSSTIGMHRTFSAESHIQKLTLK
jgi:hypothetical protein